MNLLRVALAGASLALALSASAAPESKLGTETRVRLQAAMQAHIDRTTVAGSYPKLDLATGQVHKLHPAAAHPMILRMGEFYVLCADFRDGAGKPVNIDFYVAPKDKGFSVFQVEIANRGPLEALVKAGTARMLD